MFEAVRRDRDAGGGLDRGLAVRGDPADDDTKALDGDADPLDLDPVSALLGEGDAGKVPFADDPHGSEHRS